MLEARLNVIKIFKLFLDSGSVVGELNGLFGIRSIPALASLTIAHRYALTWNLAVLLPVCVDDI